jgi:hypothetical protein
MVLFRLSGLLDTAEKVREVAGLGNVPEVKEGWNERGVVRFCVIDVEIKKKCEEWLVNQAVLRK